jgi:hypothetical protein
MFSYTCHLKLAPPNKKVRIGGCAAKIKSVRPMGDCVKNKKVCFGGCPTVQETARFCPVRTNRKNFSEAKPKNFTQIKKIFLNILCRGDFYVKIYTAVNANRNYGGLS